MTVSYVALFHLLKVTKMNSLLALVSLASLGYATSLVTPPHTGTISRPKLEPRATSTDPTDLSFINSWAALGDSYVHNLTPLPCIDANSFLFYRLRE
jgi:hypothetical protein